METAIERENVKIAVDSTSLERPSIPTLQFVEDTREAKNKYLELCVPLYKHTLEGNWIAAKGVIERDETLKHAAIINHASRWLTVLHIASATNHVHFVKDLLRELKDDHVALQDGQGNTALSFAAMSGNMEIVRLLWDTKQFLPTKRNAQGQTPIHLAAIQGKCEMTWFLYDETVGSFQVNSDWESLFFACINTCNLYLALKMARDRKKLAYARDINGRTALHLLALIQKPLKSCHHCLEHQQPPVTNPGTKKHVVFQLVNYLYNTLLDKIELKSEIIEIISKPSQLLSDAAKVGNFGFLSELLSIHPELILQVDNENGSIIHTAVSCRHASIFNLIHEIGPLKHIIVRHSLQNNDTLLHLAAKLAPSSQLELIPGAAFQMYHELLWFEEVKKIMPPQCIKYRNSNDKTAEELFTEKHEELRKKAEEWMKRTAEFGMLIATVILTGVFSAAINIPGGIDEKSKKPNYLSKTPFLVFALSDACAFFSSAAAALIFLSILMSRYVERDFYGSLPLKLIFGFITLFISISSMATAFMGAFFITYYYGLKWIPILSSSFASLTILLLIGLRSLWSDSVSSFYYCWTLFTLHKEKEDYLVTKIRIGPWTVKLFW